MEHELEAGEHAVRSLAAANRRRRWIQSAVMSKREKLHRLIDELSESDVAEALQYVTWQRADGFTRWLRSLPYDQVDAEELDPSESTGEAERTARIISFEDLRKRRRCH